MTPERYMQIRKLADDLIADCNGGAEFADEVDSLLADECKVLDGMAFRCASCDQWYDINEKATPDAAEWHCKDCTT